MAKRRLSSCLARDQITMYGEQGTNFYRVYSYHDNRAHSFEQYRILSRLDGDGMVIVVW
jgi:hypothetical protein